MQWLACPPATAWMNPLGCLVDTGCSKWSLHKSQKSIPVSQYRRTKNLHANLNFPLGCIKEDVNFYKEGSPVYTCLEPDFSFSLLISLKIIAVSLKSISLGITPTCLQKHLNLFTVEFFHPWFHPRIWKFQQFFRI